MFRMIRNDINYQVKIERCSAAYDHGRSLISINRTLLCSSGNYYGF
jgi:hypothetical protein